ncbi:hypothetical protein OPFAMLBM_00352 [Aeromonas phage avDM12-TAAL]|nr:hypothetical protein OPFAMLBM_00352 [Aeromonas phage avDM12-TAAL]
MFIKKEDMKASMAVYMNMIKDGHIEGVKVKEIYTIPVMIKKTAYELDMKIVGGVPFCAGVVREIKVPNVNFERELIGYDVVVVAKQKPVKHDFRMTEGCIMKTSDMLKAYVYAKQNMPKKVEKHLH